MLGKSEQAGSHGVTVGLLPEVKAHELPDQPPEKGIPLCLVSPSGIHRFFCLAHLCGSPGSILDRYWLAMSSPMDGSSVCQPEWQSDTVHE